jgi:hypothetical protein
MFRVQNILDLQDVKTNAKSDVNYKPGRILSHESRPHLLCCTARQ